MIEQINPEKIYNTQEAREYLKISNSTIKRWLKGGFLKANKVGGRYKILGRELIRLVSPEAETKVVQFYHNLKAKTKKAIEKW